jgi:hypothetical protein
VWEIAAAVLIMTAPPPEAPYVSCPGGYIAASVDKCPPVVKHRTTDRAAPIGGGPGGLLGLGGLLGGVL